MMSLNQLTLTQFHKRTTRFETLVDAGKPNINTLDDRDCINIRATRPWSQRSVWWKLFLALNGCKCFKAIKKTHRTTSNPWDLSLDLVSGVRLQLRKCNEFEDTDDVPRHVMVGDATWLDAGEIWWVHFWNSLSYCSKLLMSKIN